MDIETALTNKFFSSAEFGAKLEDAYNLTTATCTDVTACLEEAESQGIDIMADLREVIMIGISVCNCHRRVRVVGFSQLCLLCAFCGRA